MKIQIQGVFVKEKIFVKLLFFSMFAIFGLLIGAMLAHIIFGGEESVSSLRGSQFIVSIFCFALPAFASAQLFSKNTWQYLQIKSYPSTKNVGLTVLIFLLILPFVNLLASWNEQLSLPDSMSAVEKAMHSMEDLAKAVMLKFLSQQSLMDLVANLFFLALLPALTEELFFRGTLQRILLEKINVHAAIWISAAIFSAYHMQFFGFIPRLLLGALLGYLVLWANSLYLSIIAHFINNASLVVCYYLWKNQLISFDIEKIGVGEQSWLGLVSLVLIVPLIVILAKRNRLKKMADLDKFYVYEE